MNLIVVGTNHKYSPIEIREKLYFPKGRIKEALSDLTGETAFKAAVILSTCNRVELYATTQDIGLGVKTLKGLLSEYSRSGLSLIPCAWIQSLQGLNPCVQKDISASGREPRTKVRGAPLEPYLYTYIDKEAFFHLCKVSAGFDSQIIGESQILEQVRVAFKEAKNFGFVDSFLEGIFSDALRIAKRIREENRLSEDDVSIGSVAVDLLKDRLGSLKDKKILVIGAGKVAQLLAKYLKEESASIIFVSNRIFEKAQSLAEFTGGKAIKFDQLKEKIKEARVVISTTASPHIILRREDILNVEHNPLLIIDLACPRDIDPQIKNIEGIELYCLDDLSYIIEKNLAKKRDKIPQVIAAIRKEVEDIWDLSKFSGLEPAEALLP